MPRVAEIPGTPIVEFPAGNIRNAAVIENQRHVITCASQLSCDDKLICPEHHIECQAAFTDLADVAAEYLAL